MLQASELQIVATALFALAVIHTFLVSKIQGIGNRFPEGSVGENLFHLLGEVEAVFGLWAGIFLVYVLVRNGSRESIQFLESQNFTEPAFVFVIMTLCSSRPILKMAENIIERISQILPLQRSLSFFLTTMIIGPLLGSFITEPAAMTVTALILLNRIYSQPISEKFRYALLGLLFVNISIGGVLTPYAAPPVLMVAGKWGWDLAFMFDHFGWRAIIAVICTSTMTAFLFRKEIKKISFSTEKNSEKKKERKIPAWVYFIHLLFLILIVSTVHHPMVFIGVFLFFLGVVKVTGEYQSSLRLREALLVGFFLGGLVILGGPQHWWLQPLLSYLDSFSLYLGATALTAITDNAALTYLGSQVEGLAETSKYALVAGAVVGGGLTVIANAPNPAGYGILNSSFGKEGIRPLNLLFAALLPTTIAFICFWFL